MTSRNGQSIADIAKAKNVDVDTIINTLVTDATDEDQRAVKAGHLSQAPGRPRSRRTSRNMITNAREQRPASFGGIGGPLRRLRHGRSAAGGTGWSSAVRAVASGRRMSVRAADPDDVCRTAVRPAVAIRYVADAAHGPRPLRRDRCEERAMPERTKYAPGTPSWVDLQTTDQAGAKIVLQRAVRLGLRRPAGRPRRRRQRRLLFDGDRRTGRTSPRSRRSPDARCAAALEHLRDRRRCRRDRRAGSGRGWHGDRCRRST